MRLMKCVAAMGVLGVAASSVVAGPAVSDAGIIEMRRLAEPKKGTEMKPVHTWTGSVANEALEKDAPATSFVADGKAWETLRKSWALGDETAKVDFEKQLVLVGTTRGGRIGGGATLTDAGDLQFHPISTRDLRPGFRYLILVVPKEGVKSVNGKAI